MSKERVNTERRRFLTTATLAAGGVGVGFTAVPFIKSWKPSAKAQAAGAPVEVDISKLDEGAQMTVEWRGKPVWIIRRSRAALDTLSQVEKNLRDPNSDESVQPEYTKNQYRSLKDEVLVLLGLCTHLGCSPKYRPEVGSVNADWLGGFYCPCHGSAFDMAGRVYQGVPAPTNMTVPPHTFVGESKILIGVDHEVA